MEVTVIVQHLTLNLDGGAILLIGLFLLFVILLVRKYK
ncbi:MAG: GlyGly-CTERM sorting domain-containing protein [Fusobacterium sp.]|nr:GlyGly-CTERM sorting domain-containing protein [Fusobacterium sp.]MDY3060116.1 GlyGly-CTERM sorting domain-containing protein [Fusobacterium sp.]MEE1475535.1 GlyGly-CTERM sorting domain-containing protein [Fusobacterium sp.]